MSKQAEEKIRNEIAAATCPYCRMGWEFDTTARVPTHVRESTQQAFGSTWNCKSTVKCVRDYVATDAILDVMARMLTHPADYS